MPDLWHDPNWWAPSTPAPRISLDGLVRTGMMDARLAALVWLLVEGGLPVVVAGEGRRLGKTRLLTALLDLLPPGVPCRILEGEAEDFAWLPQAPDLGWPRALAGAPAADGEADPGERKRVKPGTLLLARELSDHTPWYLSGLRARIAIRAIQLGFGFAATAHAGSLRQLLAELAAPPVAASEDELRALGLVLILGREPDGARRVLAAHYLRPLERDREGHLQRRPPAVLATWNAARGEFEDFAWGVTSELAIRIGRTPAELEVEQTSRAGRLADLAARDPGTPEGHSGFPA